MDAQYQSKNVFYEYTEEQINYIYEKEQISLTFDEKIRFIADRVYSEVFGLSCIDELAYSSVNEVGVSNNGRYIYCWDDDKIHLSFLNLTESKLRIVQERCLSFDQKVGQLCETNPEVLCDRQDGARISAFQQPYSSERELCIRIFNNKSNSFKNIVKDSRQQLLIQTLIKCGLKHSIQGALGVGKSTLMTLLLEIMDDKLHIGTVEDYFEQHNSRKYPNKRIVELQVVDKLGKGLLDAIKSLLRASVDVINIGEARDGEAVFSYIQAAQALNNPTLFTSHIATPEDTIPRLKNMAISTGKYTSEQAAVMDLVNYVNVILQCEIIDNALVLRKTQINEIINSYQDNPLYLSRIFDIITILLNKDTDIRTNYIYNYIYNRYGYPDFLESTNHEN